MIGSLSVTSGPEYDPAGDPGSDLFASQWPAAVQAAGPRSSKWPGVRAAHLLVQPQCMACGATTALQVHHVKPFHLFPDLELDPANLLTLCECPTHNCHFIFGHLLRWDLFNDAVGADAARYRLRMRVARGEFKG